jgi:hypothetical protein
MAKR